VHPQKIQRGMHTITEESAAVDLGWCGEDAESTAVLRRESLQQRLIHAVDVLEDVDDVVPWLEIEKRDDVRRSRGQFHKQGALHGGMLGGGAGEIHSQRRDA